MVPPSAHKSALGTPKANCRGTTNRTPASQEISKKPGEIRGRVSPLPASRGGFLALALPLFGATTIATPCRIEHEKRKDPSAVSLGRKGGLRGGPAWKRM